MISAFGARAERYAQGLGEIDAIVAEQGHLVAAYREAVNRRVAGRPFYLLLFYDDQRGVLARSCAAPILQAFADHDMRLAAFRSVASGEFTLNQQRMRDIWSQPPAELAALGPELVGLADGLLVRSFAEYRRVEGIALRPRPFERVVVEPSLPAIGARRASPSVVIWAPQRPASDLAFEAFALTEFVGPVTAVCSGGSLATLPTIAFATIDDERCREALAQAGVVVCPDFGDPGDAIAFARAGFSVVAPASSGADEFVDGLTTYDVVSARMIWSAVATALGRPVGSVPPFAAPPPAPTAPALPRTVDPLPLVSVVLASRERPDDIARVRAELARQTYPNVELVVVDGDASALAEVVDATRGAYVAFLSADDRLYPDHLERLIGALLRYDAGAAHANTLVRYEQRNADGEWRTVGFNGRVFNATTFPSAALISTWIGGPSLVVRRDVVERASRWAGQRPVADQAFQLGLWQHAPVVWVDQFTVERRVREQEYITVLHSAGEMRRMYDELVPVDGRPMIGTLRAQMLESIAAQPHGIAFTATVTVDGPSP